MLTKLLPDQISEFWPIVKYAIEESLPPITNEHPDKMNRILSSALSGGLDVWVSYKKESEVKIGAVVVTKLVYDDASGTTSLLIYCLYGYNELSEEAWREGFEALAKYTKSKGGSRMVAYSSIPHLTRIANKFGANTEYTFISFDLSSFEI